MLPCRSNSVSSTFSSAHTPPGRNTLSIYHTKVQRTKPQSFENLNKIVPTQFNFVHALGNRHFFKLCSTTEVVIFSRAEFVDFLVWLTPPLTQGSTVSQSPFYTWI